MMGIPTNCKRLIECDFPLVQVSINSSEEKEIKVGSFSTIHVWWARRPLAACRAMNIACMVPDPGDDNCPTSLRRIIATALDELERAPVGQTKLRTSKISWGHDDDGDLTASRNRPKSLRKRLLRFIGDYSSWDLKMNDAYTKCIRLIITGCHDGVPKLLDSFAGGGSIPIEGKRIGMESYATDINPIPLLLNRLQLELLSNMDASVISEIDDEIDRIVSLLEQDLSDIFPSSNNTSDGEVTIGYLRAREIICEGVSCGLAYPLISSPWVAKSAKQKICYNFTKVNNSIDIQLIENPVPTQIPEQTIRRGNGTCPICKHITPVESVRKQLIRQNGGTEESRLLVTITAEKNKAGKKFRLPSKKDFEAIIRGQNLLRKFLDENPKITIPTEPLPPQGSLGTRVQGYGITEWGQLFTSRQLLINLLMVKEVKKIEDPLIRTILALIISKFNDRNSSLSTWRPPLRVFDRAFKSHRIQMTWDYYEANPYIAIGTNLKNTHQTVMRGIKSAMVPDGSENGHSSYSNATDHFLPDNSMDLWATDPPYYDSVPYSDISNYFVVWLKRMMPNIVLDGDIAPKKEELVMDKSNVGNQKKDSEWYESNVEKALAEGLRMTKPDGIAYWVYAHKSTIGWSTVLKGIVNTGWRVVGSWPISTEMKSRLRAHGAASLSTSVHIVMRPRLPDAGIGQWAEIINELPSKLCRWLTRMKKAGVMGADAIYSCIGPAMEIFSKYDSVERASGENVDIDEYIEFVWDTVADEAIKLLSPDSEQSTAEPNARFSLMAIWTLRQSANLDYSSGENLEQEEIEVAAEPSKLAIPFDTASLLARGIGAVIEDLEKSEVIDIKKSEVKILSPEDRRHYLLGVTNNTSKVQNKSSGGIQIKLGESWEEAEARVDVETKQKGLLEIPKRDSQLDKLHQAMLLHADGNSVALEAHLRDIIGNDPAIWQLANTLNTLYAEGSWERSKIEGVIARYQSLR